MDFVRIAALVSSHIAAEGAPAALDASYFEMNSPEDVANTLAPFFHSLHGPFWVAPGENGWVLVAADPESLQDDSPIRLLSHAGPEDSTFGELKSLAQGDFVPAGPEWLTSDEVAEFALGDYSGDADPADWTKVLTEFGLP